MVQELEELAMNAWPAEVIQTVEGWRLRFTQGVSRRANSVWSNESTGTTPLPERIAGAEAFYRARQADACFHLSALSPPELDAELAQRDYTANGETCVQTAAVDDVVSATAASAATWTIELHAGPRENTDQAAWPSEEWEQVAWPSAALRPAVRHGILARIGPQSVCALARDDAGHPVSAGLGVFERGHVGVFSMQTQEAARGRGLASAILHALASWGQQRGAETAYLQVEEDNPRAQSLYARSGFRPAYRYHYRSLAPGNAGVQ